MPLPISEENEEPQNQKLDGYRILFLPIAREKMTNEITGSQKIREKRRNPTVTGIFP